MKSYQDMMVIDPDDLDGEWLNQPGHYQEIAELSAQAEVEEDRAKDQLEVIKASLDIAIRSNPESHGISKVSEGAINAVITVHPDRIAAFNKLMEARQSALALKGTLTSLDHRKKALEKLVEREMAGLRAEPKAPQGVTKKEIKEQVSTNVSSRVGARMNPASKKPTQTEPDGFEA